MPLSMGRRVYIRVRLLSQWPSSFSDTTAHTLSSYVYSPRRRHHSFDQTTATTVPVSRSCSFAQLSLLVRLISNSETLSLSTHKHTQTSIYRVREQSSLLIISLQFRLASNSDTPHSTLPHTYIFPPLILILQSLWLLHSHHSTKSDWPSQLTSREWAR